jgi:hypothetical protein
VPVRRDNPERYAHGHGEQHRQDRQLDGRGEALDQELGHGLRMLDRAPEIARGELLEIVDELDGDRLVEAVAMDEVVTDLVGRPFTEDGPARVTGDQPCKREHDEHDPQQDGDRDEDAADDELRHGS